VRTGTEFGKNTERYWIIIPKINNKTEEIIGYVLFSVRNGNPGIRMALTQALVPW
jgi:hypothetical protein